jgi:hypothetical protein
MTITRDISKTFNYWRKYSSNGVTSSNINLALSLPGTRDCVNVPGYREIIRNGGNATGPYKLDASKTEKALPGLWSMTTVSSDTPAQIETQVGSGFATNLSIPVSNPTSMSKANSIALSSAYRKIRQEQQHLNLLASAAEFGDVVRQFGAPLAALVDLTNKRLNRLELERRGLKGTVVFKRAKWARIVASTWLEYAFGLAPLISDTRKVAEAYAHFNNDAEISRLTHRSKVVARGEDLAVSQGVNITQLLSSQIWIRRNSVDSARSRVQYVVGLSAPPAADFGSNDRLLQLLGVNQANLLPAAWEAIPWSWLVDYFSNVGSILDAAATSTASVSWVCRTNTVQLTREIMESVDEAVTRDYVFNHGGRTNVSFSGTPASISIIRTVLDRFESSLGIPPLYLEIPSSWGQYANMVSVLLARREKTSALWLF